MKTDDVRSILIGTQTQKQKAQSPVPHKTLKIAQLNGPILAFLPIIRIQLKNQKKLNQPFRCQNCRQMVPTLGAGSQHRNHCPNCLHSVHLDTKPGDRSAACSSTMEPISVWARKGGEWAIIHRCTSCGALSSNRIAADDNPYVLLQLAAKPLALPPFPVDRISG